MLLVDATDDDTGEIAIGYHISRAAFLMAYGFLIPLFILQQASQYYQKGWHSLFDFKTVHAAFNLGGLAASVIFFTSWIDVCAVFGAFASCENLFMQCLLAHFRAG